MLLVVAGVQTVCAQKVIVKLNDQTIKYKVSEVEYVAFEEAVEYQYVDLGLPSGTLWATTNIGANSPEEFGDFIAWGELSPKPMQNYTWEFYKYCEGSQSTLTKYCSDSSLGFNGFTDDKTELLPEDDAANYNWDENWQMPSKEQFEELFNSDYTTTSWTEVNGVTGKKITSNFNDESIFLPATGIYNGSYVGTQGAYWSRSLFTGNNTGAYYLNFSWNSYYMGGRVRSNGVAVRPVRVEKAAPTLVSRIDLNKTGVSLTNGQTVQLIAVAYPLNARNRAVSWGTSNPSVATVDQSGNVTAVTAGTCTITCYATDGSGVKATCSVVVTQLVTSITLSPTSLTINIGDTYRIYHTVNPSNASNDYVSWSSSNTSVATVDQSGNVKAVDKGSCTITCSSNDGSGVKATCSVTVVQKVTGITLSPTSLSMIKGSSRVITATVLPSTASNPNVTWTSSNSNVASVNYAGKVTANALGACYVTCSATDGSGYYAVCYVNVTATPQYVDLGLPSGTLWATFNIGANSPEDYGDYFAWAETQPKSEYTWGTYTYGYGSYTSMKKYNATDNKTELDASDDAATTIWGSSWQTPSVSQCYELVNGQYTKNERVTVNGVAGVRCTSRSNGKSVFFPATGYRSGTELCYSGSTGSGNYWSRSLQSSGGYSFAIRMHFSAQTQANDYNEGDSRFHGVTIRPVRKQ